MQKPIRTARRLYDIMQDLDLYTDNTDTRLQITVDGETIATHLQIANLWLRYSGFIYTQSDLVHYMGASGEVRGGYVLSDWAEYNARNAENLKRMIDALYAEYNPIDNYNMIEESVAGDKQDSHKTTPHGTVTSKTTATGAGIDTVGDGSVSGTTSNTTSYQNADSETSYDNTKSMVFDGTTKTGYHKTNEHYTKRSGNIGVTTSAQMIEQELTMRTIDLLARYVADFMHKYLYYVG